MAVKLDFSPLLEIKSYSVTIGGLHGVEVPVDVQQLPIEWIEETEQRETYKEKENPLERNIQRLEG